MRKETKKILALTILGLIIVSFSTFLISAQAEQTAEDITKGISGAGKIANAILSPLFGEKEILTRLLFAVILFMVYYSVIPLIVGLERKTISIILTIAITALSLLALPSNFIEAIRTQYGVVGAAILSMIPFIIMCIFTLRMKSTLAGRVLWLFYTVYYAALYIYMIVSTPGPFEMWAIENIPYFAALIGGAIMLIFIVKIKELVFKGEMEEIKAAGKEMIAEGALLRKLKEEELKAVYGK